MPGTGPAAHLRPAMSHLRTDIWISAFVRRHNLLGRICVVARRGDPIAGQVWVEIDHLDGTLSLFTPAPIGMDPDAAAGRPFTLRFDHATPGEVGARIAREADFDPDLWVVSLEMRGDDFGLDVVG